MGPRSPPPPLLSSFYDHGGNPLSLRHAAHGDHHLALAATKDVYGIRRLSFDRAARTLRVEFDATRLNAATVTQLVRKAGLDLDEELPLIAPPPAAEPVAAA